MARRKLRKCRHVRGQVKIMYRDKVAALFAISQARKRDSSTRSKLEERAYYHHPCRSWHTTSVSREEWERRITELRAQQEGSAEDK